MIVIWLLFVGVIGIGTVDAVSIAFTKFRMSDVASSAASTAADAYAGSKDVAQACAAARSDASDQDPDATIGKKDCTVNTRTGDVTVTVHKTASTMVAGRISFTKNFADVEATATSGPSQL